MPPPIVYFDTCALNRISDDLSQPRIRSEATAVSRMLDLVSAEQLIWIASTVLDVKSTATPIRFAASTPSICSR